MEEWKGKFGVFIVNGALTGALVVFILTGWMLVLDLLHVAWFRAVLRPESQVKVLAALILAFFVIVLTFALRNLRSKLRGDPLVVALILCIAFLGMRAHRYIFYWDWKRSCATGYSTACWSLAKAHQKQSGFGMHPSNVAYYEDQACEHGSEYGCVAMIRRGETDFSPAQCEFMAWYCGAPATDSMYFENKNELLCSATEAHCKEHIPPE